MIMIFVLNQIKFFVIILVLSVYQKNLVHQCWTKYIDIKHYFIEDHMIKGEIKILFIGMLDQLADILTKPLLEERFGTLRSALGIISNSH